MPKTTNKYYRFFLTLHEANERAVSPMYQLIVGLSILIGALLLKNLHFKGMEGFIYLGAIYTLMMLIKASFHYYWKSRKLEKKLQKLNRQNDVS